MKILHLPTIAEINESDTRRLFIGTYVINDRKPVVIKYRSIQVTFSEEDFDHAVYEPDKEGNKKGKFSKRRASRILWIKELLKGKLPHKLLFEPETGNYCLFCQDMEYVVFLWPDKNKKTLRFRSAWAFGKKIEHAMKKYKEGEKFIEVKSVKFE